MTNGANERITTSVCCLLLGLGVCSFADDQAPASTPNVKAEGESFEQAVLPFLTKHCVRCHGEKLQKGELRVDTLSRDFIGGGSAGHWGDVMYRISSAEMP